MIDKNQEFEDNEVYEEDEEKLNSLNIKYELCLSDLSDSLQNKNFARVTIRKLKVERTKKMIHDLMEFRKQTTTSEFDNKIRSKIYSFNVAHSNDFIAASTSTNELYCADLVFLAYKAMGVIGEDASDDEIHTPDDFTSRSLALELQKGELEKEVWLSRKFNPMSQKYEL